MPVIPVSKYELKDLHQEIDFFDRKIAYCKTYETFASEEARAAALQVTSHEARKSCQNGDGSGQQWGGMRPQIPATLI